ncbi:MULTISPECIES: fimbrial protein [Serratia]|nr:MULTISPECIES: fimbrial protein [Serratia]
MNKHIINLGLLASLVMGATGVAHAANTINITGEVASTTCDIALDGGDKPVDLGTALASKFKDINTISNEKSFTLNFSGCETDDASRLNKLALKVSGSDTVPTLKAQGLFGDSATYNTGVAISLTDADQNTLSSAGSEVPLKAHSEGSEGQASVTVDPVVLTAAMKSFSKAKEGKLKAAVELAIGYN